MPTNMTLDAGRSLTYRDAGVDFGAKERAFSRMKAHLRSTYRGEVLSELGDFGGLFALGRYREPVLVSSVDSVGTKLKVAFALHRHESVGHDIVAHCGNDILVHGAEPLFFLDYIGIGRLEPDVVAELVEGLARGCREIGCALIGGETAELPDLYAVGEYDLAGCIVGVVERSQMLTGEQVRPGDALLGLPALGLHTNGYSLARRVLFQVEGLSVQDEIPGLGISVGAELLKEHKAYVRPVRALLRDVAVHGLAHITGGGLPDNVARVLPDGCRAVVERGSWNVPPIFRHLQEAGNIAEAEMYRVFNMGVGMVVIVPPEERDNALARLRESGEEPRIVGQVVAGDRGVEIL
jgi:phosphoribosylformylglycinamidine cyclo-ligase